MNANDTAGNANDTAGNANDTAGNANPSARGGKGKINLLNEMRTQEERKLAAIKASRASVAARKSRVTMREDAIAILSAIVRKPELVQGLKQLGLDDANPTIQRAILAGQAVSAIKGNTKAAEYLRDTCGEKPVEHIADLTKPPTITFGLLREVSPATDSE